MTNSDVGNQDRHVVQDVLKDIAQTQQVDLNAKKRFKGGSLFSNMLRQPTDKPTHSSRSGDNQ